MSRIDEALKQAGLKAATAAPVEDAASLDAFPLGPETAAEPGPRLNAEPARPAAPAAKPKAPHDSRLLAGEKLVLHAGTGRACVEQYRRIAAMLHHLQEERGTKVVMVASATIGEGKTLTAANLALTLSESYKRRVLLMDADLRRPSLGGVFQLQTVVGLSEKLRGETDGPLRVLELSPFLALLPGGRPDSDPMAGLTSGRMQQIMHEASASYDWVILDTPPVALQPDASLLAAMVDATVLVVGAGLAPAALVESAIETIGRDKIVGVVLNRVEEGVQREAAYFNYHYGHAAPEGEHRMSLASTP